MDLVSKQLIVKLKYNGDTFRLTLPSSDYQKFVATATDLGATLDSYAFFAELAPDTKETQPRFRLLSEAVWTSMTDSLRTEPGNLPVVKVRAGRLVGHVSALSIFPIKSTRAVALKEAVACSFGFSGDRQLAIVDAYGKCVTQRMLPALAGIEAELGASDSRGGTSKMTLRSSKDETGVEFEIPQSGPVKRVKLYAKIVDGLDCGDAAAGWLTKLLEFETSTHSSCFPPYRLAVLAPGQARRCCDAAICSRCDHEVADHDQVALADFAPLLLTCTTSLESLNKTLPDGHSVPMDRFRPNIVVTPTAGQKAWAEDGWSHMCIGEVEIRSITRDPRCVMPTVNQETGAAGFQAALSLGDESLTSELAEPMATLKRTRPWNRWNPSDKDRKPEDGGTGGQPNGLFGIYCGFQHSGECGSVHLGDPVALIG
mmetsp:Transcript_87747/g.174169  ORF Transcript_87747/g.174169 Transcript_87747/m.174169 type:complete len:427 (+) Transcript_87747:111-1391(+)